MRHLCLNSYFLSLKIILVSFVIAFSSCHPLDEELPENAELTSESQQPTAESEENVQKEIPESDKVKDKTNSNQPTDNDVKLKERREEWNRGIVSCFKFLDKELSDQRRIDTIDNYASLQSHVYGFSLNPEYVIYNKEYSDCYQKLTDIFWEKTPTNPIFYMKNFEYEEKEVLNVLNVFNRLYEYYYESNRSSERSIDKDLFSSKALQKYTLLLLEIYPFSYLMSSDGHLLTQNELSSISSYSDKNKSYLKNVLKYIDIAIEQQKVLTGKRMMPNLLADLKSSDLAVRKKLYDILKVAKLAAKNLFLQDIKKIKSAKSSQDLNDNSFTVENIENLRKHFSSWDFINDTGSLRVVYRMAKNNKKEFDPESDVKLELAFEDGKYKEELDKTGYIRSERLQTLQGLREKVKKEEEAKINYAEKFKKGNG